MTVQPLSCPAVIPPCPASTAIHHHYAARYTDSQNFIGALCAGPIGDFVGRRWGLMVATAVFTVGCGVSHHLGLY